MAKPLTRLARTILNRMGYDLLRLQKTNIHHEARSGLGRGEGFDAFEAILPRPVKSFDIYFRCCARVEIFGQSRNRIVDVLKQELIARCLNRLIQSVNHALSHRTDIAVTVWVMDDHSDAGCVKQIKILLDSAHCKANLISLDVTGNGPSVGAALRHAKTNVSDVVYFVEDDYLHAPHAIYEMMESYERLAAAVGGEDVVLFPSDYPDRYRTVEPSLILLGSHRHWRSVPSTTFTCVTTKGLLDRFWDCYIGLEKYGLDPEVTEESTINRVYREVFCFSPLKSLAVHLQHFDTLAPYVDWRNWWQQSAIDDNS